MARAFALSALVLSASLLCIPTASADCVTFGPLTVTPEHCVDDAVDLTLEVADIAIGYGFCVVGVVLNEPIPGYPMALLACRQLS